MPLSGLGCHPLYGRGEVMLAFGSFWEQICAVWLRKIPPIDVEAAARRLSRFAGFAWMDGGAALGRAGRWSYLACDPDQVRQAFWGECSDPFERLPCVEHSDAAEPVTAQAPQWIGYVSYDAAWCRARDGHRHPRHRGRPVLWFGRYAAVLAIDHATGHVWVIADDQAAGKQLMERLSRGECAPRVPTARVGSMDASSAADHLAAIKAAKRLIAEGEIYQVNLARCWKATFSGAPFELFEAMRARSRVPLGFFLEPEPGCAIASRSMECFIRWSGPGGMLCSRPIKGTVSGDDANSRAALQRDPKEHAEHAMIVDLVRNDLGRVAQVGTVRVDPFMEVEPYQTLSHLVSTVRCSTRDDVRLRDLFQACFPPASVTGAPKKRAVEIIESLEPTARGVYTGCLGYIRRDGGCSFAVAIRTATTTPSEVQYHAGGGIVWPSDPWAELRETELKARVFLDATDVPRRAERPLRVSP